MSESKVIDGSEHFYRKQDYDYGAKLAEQGIGMKEMQEDFPKTCLCEDIMRGYHDTWKRKGVSPWF